MGTRLRYRHNTPAAYAESTSQSGSWDVKPLSTCTQHDLIRSLSLKLGPCDACPTREDTDSCGSTVTQLAVLFPLFIDWLSMPWAGEHGEDSSRHLHDSVPSPSLLTSSLFLCSFPCQYTRLFAVLRWRVRVRLRFNVTFIVHFIRGMSCSFGVLYTRQFL